MEGGDPSFALVAFMGRIYRFLRRSADDLSEQEAWQLLRKEEPGIVTPEMLLEDAKNRAVHAGLSTASVPIVGPDGMPRLQEVHLEDLLSPPLAAPAAAPAASAEAARATSSCPHATEVDSAKRALPSSPLVQSAESLGAEAAVPTTVGILPPAEAGGTDTGGSASDLEIPAEKLQEEILALSRQLSD